MYSSSFGQCPAPTPSPVLEEQCVTFTLESIILATFTSPGFIGPASCPVGTPEYSVNGGPFTPTLPVYDPINPLTINAQCDCGNGTVSTGSGSTMTMPNPNCLTIPLTFFDPCDCANPLNCFSNGVQHNHDVLELMFPPGAVVTIESATGGFLAESPCDNGGAIIPHTFGNQFTEVSPGVYDLEFWKTYDGNLPAVTVRIDVDGAGPLNPFLAVVPPATFATHVSPDCDCTGTGTTPIPTMSEWGLMIFGLLILNLGLFFVFKQEQILTTSVGQMVVNVNPFDKSRTFRYFSFILMLLAIIFIIAIQLFGYELMTFDIPGSILTALLLAHLFQLLSPIINSTEIE